MDELQDKGLESGPNEVNMAVDLSAETPDTGTTGTNAVEFEVLKGPTAQERLNTRIEDLMFSVDHLSRNKYARTHGFTMPLPPYVNCKFRPTVDMELDPYQVALCAFLWHPKTDPHEIIFRVGDTTGTRKDFDSLCPGRSIPAQLITWMALKATSVQKRVTEQTIWSLPPSFVRDVMNMTTIEEMVNVYVKDWMEAYDGLQHIYIPIEEEGSGHWYLGVLSIEEQLIYHFDSHQQEELMESRRETLKNVCEVIAQIVATDFYPHNFLRGAFQSDAWEFSEPRGIPNCGHSKNSAIWVMHWQDMEHCFANNHVGVFNERAVRMKLAMALLCGAHNQCWAEVQEKADAFWDSVRYSNAS